MHRISQGVITSIRAGFPMACAVRSAALSGARSIAARESSFALKTTEIGKIDAGLSCMSLRWWKK
ncbi:hypothetical protein [Aliihoeflea sp. PC F10.4]